MLHEIVAFVLYFIQHEGATRANFNFKLTECNSVLTTTELSMIGGIFNRHFLLMRGRAFISAG